MVPALSEGSPIPDHTASTNTYKKRVKRERSRPQSVSRDRGVPLWKKGERKVGDWEVLGTAAKIALNKNIIAGNIKEQHTRLTWLCLCLSAALLSNLIKSHRGENRRGETYHIHKLA